ncbi:unnamed protein product [Protopolystoma xenopodis]|uniref:Uncharacterized protein n=1 Tax=Protopolystoma xenopodis TaxID=117903 RepID=A0A448XKQ9_9PLAT|nr:unnamed protein product [Protopolystoma xenopodis]
MGTRSWSVFRESVTIWRRKSAAFALATDDPSFEPFWDRVKTVRFAKKPLKEGLWRSGGEASSHQLPNRLVCDVVGHFLNGLVLHPNPFGRLCLACVYASNSAPPGRRSNRGE